MRGRLRVRCASGSPVSGQAVGSRTAGRSPGFALGLGLWLGLVTEQAGSALPAVVSHVINNVLFTMLTALGLTVEAFWPNAAVGAGALLLFAGCAAVVVRGHR